LVSQRKRHLFLGLGLVVALALAVSPASASAVSTLTGENLNGFGEVGTSPACPTPTFSVGGTATAPYPGTFSESGSWEGTLPPRFSATFTITSPSTNTTITGHKTPGGTPVGFGVSCGIFTAVAVLTGVPYTATIQTPTGNFHDEGTSSVEVLTLGESVGDDIVSSAALRESFTSSLTQPTLIGPTSKDQCKNNGWKNFPQFKNQGQCVSFVQSHSQT
jgi:hypothetical protein